MRAAEGDRIDALAGRGREAVAGRAQHLRRHADNARGRHITEGGRESRRLGRGAHDVEEADRTRGGGGGTEGLEPVLGDARRQPVDRGDRAPDLAAEQGAEHGVEGLARLEGRREGRGLEHHARAAVLGEVKPGLGRPAGDRRRDVEEVAVAVAARAEHGIDEGDGVALAPGDLLAEPGAMAGLIGGTGPGRLAAESLIGAHHAQRHRVALRLGMHALGVDEVEGTDVERRRDGDLAPARHQLLRELGAAVAVIEAAVDVGRGDRDEPGRPQDARGLGHDAQRHRARGCRRLARRPRPLLRGQSQRQ